MTLNNDSQTQLEKRFLATLRDHLDGLRRKVESEFSQQNYEAELDKLESDLVYAKFAFDSPEYALIRFMGRVSVSIGRRLGEIYDRVPRFVASARFGLSPSQVAPKLHNLELDIGIKFSDLTIQDVDHVKAVVDKYLEFDEFIDGIGIEIRYIFTPADSARLRKDEDMAAYLLEENLLPIYLVFSALSPRDEAIARLKRANWNFVIGEDATNFTRELLGLDINEILDRPVIKSEIKREVDETMRRLFESYTFRKVSAKYSK